MGAITGMLGLGGGASGTGFAGPQQVADKTGMNNLQTTYQALNNVASGSGPNPAMDQYNQNIQGLAQQQAGAISSVQGISPALATRLISQQGSAAMQNAAAGGATAQSNQQLGALGQMGNVASAQAQNALGMQSNINNANANLAQTSMGQQQKTMQGIGSSLPLIGNLFKSAPVGAAHGGMIEGGPASSFGKHITMKGGGFVPGQAKVAGDSPKNDVVNAKLSPGEIVLPRTVVNSKNPSEAAARFVAAVLAKKGKK